MAISNTQAHMVGTIIELAVMGKVRSLDTVDEVDVSQSYKEHTLHCSMII